MARRLLLFVMCVLTLPTLAQPVVNGSLDVDYGPPLTVQTVETSFGDFVPPGDLTGAELDAGYATIVGGRLYVLLTGNIDPVQTLDVFIDSVPGGENVLSNVPSYDAGRSANFNGMTFDAGFTADYHLFARFGGVTTTDPFTAAFVARQGGAAAMVPGSDGATANTVALQASGTIAPGDIGANASGTALTQALAFAINDNNGAGVAGGTAAANGAAAAAVTTGIEFSIALADLGNPAPGSVIRIFAAINNTDHNFLSNQLLGGVPAPQVSLGGDGAAGFTGSLAGINLNNFAGDQFFSVTVPAAANGTPPVPALSGWGIAALTMLLVLVAVGRGVLPRT